MAFVQKEFVAVTKLKSDGLAHAFRAITFPRVAACGQVANSNSDTQIPGDDDLMCDRCCEYLLEWAKTGGMSV